MLNTANIKNLPFRDVYKNYATSYFLRYIGGYWGGVGFRHVNIVKKHGLSNQRLLSSALLEAILLMSASLMISSWVVYSEFPKLISCCGVVIEAVTIVLFLILMVYASWWLWRHPHDRKSVFQAFCCYALALLTYSCVFALLLRENPYSVFFKAGVFNLSWLAGQITPGAVQGLGVRETVSTTLLSETGVDAGVLLAVIRFRFINILADILFFIAPLLEYFKARKWLGFRNKE